jgi:hypothetical protein
LEADPICYTTLEIFPTFIPFIISSLLLCML